MAKKGGKDFKRGDPDHPSHKQLAPNGLSFGVMMRNAIAAAVDEKTLTAIVKAQAQKAKDGDTDAFRALTDRKAASLLMTFARFLEDQGIRLLSSAELCPGLLAPRGVLGGRPPTPRERLDAAFGWRIARELGRLDIGQSALVHERAVVALEAIEGTDAAIRRAGSLVPRGGFGLVKVAKPDQDMRFDVPALGPLTVRTLADAGGSFIAYEADRTLLIDADEAIRVADERGVALFGYSDEEAAKAEAEHAEATRAERDRLGAFGRAAGSS